VIRKMEMNDAAEVYSLIEAGRARLKAGGIDQWQNNYPLLCDVEEDAGRGNGYIMENDGMIAAYGVLQSEAEPTYKNIYEGRWLTEGGYATIHRLCVAQGADGKGLGGRMMDELIALAGRLGHTSVRVDTHRQNTVMQHMLSVRRFERCGIVYMSDGSERIAYELIL